MGGVHRGLSNEWVGKTVSYSHLCCHVVMKHGFAYSSTNYYVGKFSGDYAFMSRGSTLKFIQSVWFLARLYTSS